MLESQLHTQVRRKFPARLLGYVNIFAFPVVLSEGFEIVQGLGYDYPEKTMQPKE